MVELVPLAERIGTEVRGIDVTRPIPDAVFERIYKAWLDSTILLIREQEMTPDQHVDFTRRFGEVVSYTRREFAEGGRPEILVLSNRTEEGRPVGSPVSGRVWHTDGHYLPAPPAGSMLHAIEVPPEGDHPCPLVAMGLVWVWFPLLYFNKKRPDLAGSTRGEHATHAARFIRRGLASLW